MSGLKGDWAIGILDSMSRRDDVTGILAVNYDEEPRCHGVDDYLMDKRAHCPWAGDIYCATCTKSASYGHKMVGFM